MVSLSWKTLCVFLIAGSIGIEASPQLSSGKVLRAAMRRSDLAKRRDMRIEKKYEAEIVYIEEHLSKGNEVFASELKVSADRPILSLEEIEHHLTSVTCKGSVLELGFVDKESAADAGAACHGEEGGLVITSHESCNVEGERSVYRIHGFHHGEDGTSLELDITQASWEHSFSRFDISFGHTKAAHNYRRFRSKHSTNTKRASKTDKVNPPEGVPENVNQATFDLAWKLENKTFDPAAFLSGLPAGFTPAVDLSNIPIEIGCRKCETKGQLLLTQGAITIDMKQFDVVPDFFQGKDDGKDISSVVTGGFFELKAEGMEGSFELFARPKSSGSFSIMLFGLPVLGFYIPGIGRAGAVFEASLVADYEVTGHIEMNYGMKLTVPNGATIRTELTDIAKSPLNGFQDTTIEPLPFTFDISDVNAGLSLALAPSIPIGFKFANMLDASVSVDLELPRLNANMAMVRDVDVNCSMPQPQARGVIPKMLGGNEKREEAPFANQTQATIPGPLVHIEANASIVAHLGFDLAFPLLPPPAGNPLSASAQIFSTERPLPTLCLVPQSKFLPASVVFANGVTPTPTMSEGAEGTGTGGVLEPTGGNMSRRWAGEEIYALGAAERSVNVGGMEWGWRFGVLGVSFAVGALMVGL